MTTTSTNSTWEPKRIEDADILYDVAHARSGDKSDIFNVVVIPFDDDVYEDLVELITVEQVEDHFGGLVAGDVERHCVPNLSCLNFVFNEALDGGWSRSLRLDGPGKSMSQYMLRLPLDESE